MPQAPKLYIGQHQITFGADISGKIIIPTAFSNTDIQFVGFLPNTDSSLIKDWTELFANCIQLRDVDLGNIDPSNALDLSNMFYNCDSLTNNSLNNILDFCIRATRVLDKDLELLGFSSSQITSIKSCPNYTTALNAGWYIGSEV